MNTHLLLPAGTNSQNVLPLFIAPQDQPPRMHSLALVLAILSCAVSSRLVTAAYPSIPAIYIFGDSTADVGNNNYLPGNPARANYHPYGVDYPHAIPTGRFCNGYVGVDFMAMRLGFKRSPPAVLSVMTAAAASRGLSFASGGSGILDQTGHNEPISMNTQIKLFNDTIRGLEMFHGTKRASLYLSKSIFVFSTVYNDLFAFVNNDPIGAVNETLQDCFITSLSTQFELQLEILYGLGARKMVVFGTSGFGHHHTLTYGISYLFPTHSATKRSLRERSPIGDCMDILGAISYKFNIAMKEKMKALSSKLQGLKYSYVNSYDVTREVVDRAAEYGFMVTNNACCGFDEIKRSGCYGPDRDGFVNTETFCFTNSTYCSNRDEYMLWDSVHPTQAYYKRFMDLVFTASPRFVEPISIQEVVM